jgi:hypothetical protein
MLKLTPGKLVEWPGKVNHQKNVPTVRRMLTRVNAIALSVYLPTCKRHQQAREASGRPADGMLSMQRKYERLSTPLPWPVWHAGCCV